jgi:hypothetical protein
MSEQMGAFEPNKPGQREHEFLGGYTGSKQGSAESNEADKTTERDQVALQSVVDGTFNGVVFDPESQDRAVASGAQIEEVATGQMNTKGEPIVALVAKLRDDRGNLLSEKSVGYKVSGKADITRFN